VSGKAVFNLSLQADKIPSSAGVLPEKSSCKPKSLISEACADFLSPDKVVDAIEYLIGLNN
jgi:hypothetical protein